MANFRKGAQAVQEAATRSGSGKFTPTIRWKAGEKKYILFLQPMDEIVTVLMHNFVIIGHSDASNKPIYSSYISRRDPALDGDAGYDELWDRFDKPPKSRTIGLAVELEPKTEKVNGRNKVVGFDIAKREFERDGETVKVPAVGLIIESPFTFWGWLSTYADDAPIESQVLAVTRRGAKTDTSYDFIPVGDPPDVEEVLREFQEEFDFDAYLDELASEERMREEIGPLPDSFTVDEYQKKGKDAKRPKNSRFQAAPEVEEEGTSEETAEEGSAAAARFNNLKKDFGKE